MHKSRMSLSRLLAVLLLAVLVAGVLAACGAPAAESPAAAPAAQEAAAPAAQEAAAPAAAEATAGSANEAPMLQEMVKAGTLAPLEERLPVNPLVVEPVETIGKYGGTWRAGLRGGSDNAWMFRTIGYDTLVTWTRDWTGVEPNVAESWEANAEATEYTFKLREGMKWSDGAPFTADDILFWYEDVLMNTDLTPSVPNWMRSGDEPALVEKIDDFTVKFTFPQPNGVLLLRLASPDGPPVVGYPKHYMQQFHPKYNPDAVKAATDAGFADWMAFFNAKNAGGCCGFFADANLPTLNAWKITQAYGENTTSVRAERNPYYWKVDTAGNQLPYIDYIAFDVGNDVETLVLKALNGEIDFQDRHIATFNNKAVFFDGQDAGGYRIVEKQTADNNVMEISFNLNHLDPMKNEIFNNLDFRIGLSHAINRQEIIDLVYVGQGQPWQAAPFEASPYYNEQLATQYLEFNLDLANEHLDKAGLTEKDADGFRLGPDGNRFSFTIDVPTVNTEHIDMLELIEGYWAAVGIEMKSNVIDRALGQQRLEVLEHDANVWGAPGGIGFGTLLDPRNFLPVHGHSRYGYAWYLYWVNPEGALAQEPPASVLKQFDLYNQVNSSADPAEQTRLMQEIMQIAADNFYMIGISKPPAPYAIAAKNLRNIMENMPSEWQYPTPAPSDTFQWFFE